MISFLPSKYLAICACKMRQKSVRDLSYALSYAYLQYRVGFRGYIIVSMTCTQCNAALMLYNQNHKFLNYITVYVDIYIW